MVASTRRAGEPPDPSGARTVEELSARLRSLRSWAGWSYRDVHREVARDRLARGVPELPVYNTVYRCFQSGRSRLDAELVVDIARALLGDSAGAEAWRSACRVVAGQADAAAIVDVADRLPPDLPTFVGRDGELRAITEAGEPVVAIEGMAGVGKTRLAAHAAHALLRAGRYADIQLSVDLRGYDPERPPADPAAVLDGFLRRLGLRGDRIQHLDLGGRAAEYRRLLAGRRALVLLDNAASAEQVRALLPADPGALVLITSRHHLAGLPGLRRLALDAFGPEEALSLLRGTSHERVDAEQEAAGRIAHLLGNLPLALAVTAARIRASPDWTLADHLERLTRHRDALRLDDSVELSLGLSYRELAEPLRRTFRLLAVHPGDDLEAYVAAALAGTGLAEAKRRLETLRAANLLMERAAGRYAFHDLVRIHATDRVHDEEPASARKAAADRLFAYYEYAASRAMDQYSPHEKNIRPDIPPSDTPVPDFAERGSAIAWLEAERHNLIAAARYAAENGRPIHASHQSDVLMRYLETSGLFTDAAILHTLASRTDDPDARGRAFNNLGNVYLHLGRHEEALRLFQSALPGARDAGDRQTQRRLLNHMGVALMLLGRMAEALPHYEETLRIVRDLNDPLGEAITLDNLGNLFDRLGRPDEALDLDRQALVIARRLGERTLEGRILGNIGYIYARLDRKQEALAHHRQSLAIAREVGDRRNLGVGLDNIGMLHLREGRRREAAEHHRQALEVASQIGDRELAAAALLNLGITHSAADGHRDALGYYEQALDIAHTTGLAQLEGEILNAIGEALIAMDSFRDSLGHLERALAIATSIGDGKQEARAHDGIGAAALALGDRDAARTHWRAAELRYADIGAGADAVRARLAGLDDPARTS